MAELLLVYTAMILLKNCPSFVSIGSCFVFPLRWSDEAIYSVQEG
jgi:hypothetical protein